MSGRPVVLVLRALRLGDFLTGVPALRALRRRFPGHELVLAAPAELAPLAWTGAVDRVLPTGALRPLRWAGPGRLDVLVNLHGRGPQSHRLLAVLPAGHRIGFRCAAVPGFDGPTWRLAEHEVRRLVAGAGLVVCGDTGIAHLATATGTRSVLLFGPVPPAEWGPLRDGDRHAVLWAGRRGDPHGTEPDPGLLALTIPEVLTAARALLDGTGVAAG